MKGDREPRSQNKKMNSSSKADMKSDVFLNDFACSARKTVICNDKKLSLHHFLRFFDANPPDADHTGVLTASVRDCAFAHLMRMPVMSTAQSWSWDIIATLEQYAEYLDTQ